MSSLPQSFHEPILPEGSISDDQVCPSTQNPNCSLSKSCASSLYGSHGVTVGWQKESVGNRQAFS